MGNATAFQRKPATSARGKPVVQTKLAVGPMHDRFEREANRVADSVVAGRQVGLATPPPVISGLNVQRAAVPVPAVPEQQEEERAAPEQRAQRSARGTGPEAPAKPPLKLDEIDDPKTVADQLAQTDRSISETPGIHGGTASSHVEASIQSMRRRPAAGLDPETRTMMEDRIGTDFGGVKVHNDTAAGDAANALGARAFTVGQDMFFGRSEFNPKSAQGQRLIAHELTHTIQQHGGSAAAQRIQREESKSATTSVKTDDATEEEVTKLEGKDWAVELTEVNGHPGTVTVSSLELPLVAGALKGASGGKNAPVADKGRSLPVADQPFTLAKTSDRPEGKAYETWVEFTRKNYSAGLKTKLETQIKDQGNAASVVRGGAPVYVLYSGGKTASSATTIVVGTLDELAKHDSVVRPMLGPQGGDAALDADHILELQIGGLDAAENMWLLESSYNRSVGSSIKGNVDAKIKVTLEKAAAELKKLKNAKTPKSLPRDVMQVKRHWMLQFKTIKKGNFGTTRSFWTKQQIKDGEQLKYFKAMTEKELAKQGFKFKEGEVPTHISVFPNKDGGRAIRFSVSDDGSKLKKPGFFFRGFYVMEDADFKPPTRETPGGVLATLKVRRKKKKDKKSDIIVFADKEIAVRHDVNLGYGGYITRDSLSAAFHGLDFQPLSPLSFSNVQITPDGDLFAEGSLRSSKSLLPNLNVPIILRGDEILMQFPVPAESLSFGPVRVTEAALELGVGEQGFFIQGMAAVAVDSVGQGTLSARVIRDDVIFKGDFNLELDFLDPAKVEATYSLAKDDFLAKATLGVKKDSLPGVDSGQVTVTITRESFGIVGSLNLGGVLSGSTITVGYTPETGLLIEGQDLPLPVEKLPGVSDAKVTVKAVRNPETGVWLISGGGKASLGIAGATGTLDILFDGEAVTFRGRADVAKGPVSGWIDVRATNRAIDDKGEPVEGGPVGDFTIWGQGQASIVFGKILTGTAGIEYTPDGRIILSGEIALPPTFDVFPKVPYNKSLLKIAPPDFPIWGVKLGPVGIGIFAFVDAELRFEAFVGPGQLRDTKVKATLDIDKPEDAVVEGQAMFFVPSYAGLTLDLGGGLKAQVAVAYVKGRVGLDGTLGISVDVSAAVDVNWNRTDGLALAAEAEITGRPKFEVGVNASVTAGVDLPWPLGDIEKTWGPWRKKLGEFGPDMELGASFPIKWSENKGLDLSLDNIKLKKPKLDAKAIMKDAFDMLV